mmetsp:Transcript_16696/g.29862  ORF Transcript_16696/g.29862 Transcript_16696/m.29862 type:complete len:121 (-) Transcript_16696:1774-2136(-)
MFPGLGFKQNERKMMQAPPQLVAQSCSKIHVAPFFPAPCSFGTGAGYASALKDEQDMEGSLTNQPLDSNASCAQCGARRSHQHDSHDPNFGGLGYCTIHLERCMHAANAQMRSGVIGCGR